MNKLGMHIHGMQTGVLEAVSRLQPRTNTIMDPEPKDIRAIQDASPETFIVMRKYEDGRAWQDTDPFDWAEQNYDMSQGLANGVIAWNEPFGHDDRSSCTPFDEWTYAFLIACRQFGTMEAVTLCMATGNWTGADDRYKITDDFPLTCANATYFGPHEYSWPTLQAGAGWYALRFKAWIEDLKAAGRDDFYFVISEAGLTQAIIAGRDDVGWRSGGPEGVTEDSYIATLDWYNEQLCKAPEVLGCCLFDYAGQWYGWPTFEQLGLENRIYQIQAPEEPNNGGNMDIKIYDFDGNEKDWDWLRPVFGNVKVHPVEDKFNIESGDHVYKVVSLRAKRGYAACLINLKGLDGKNVQGKTVMWGWSGAPSHGYGDLGWNWTEIGVPGDTNSTGDVGPGMGTGAYYDPSAGERGPHWCWAWDMASDYVDGIGMLAMTNHDHVDVGYQEVVWDEEEPGSPTHADLLAAIKINKALLNNIKTILGQPPEKEVFTGEYFNNKNLSGAPTFTREDEQISFFWADDGPGGGISPNQFSVRWRGSFTFEARDYTFYTLVDDGVRLWVNGNLIITQWHDQSPTTHKATVTLSAGKHNIVMEYYENAGGATAKLWWD